MLFIHEHTLAKWLDHAKLAKIVILGAAHESKEHDERFERPNHTECAIESHRPRLCKSKSHLLKTRNH